MREDSARAALHALPEAESGPHRAVQRLGNPQSRGIPSRKRIRAQVSFHLVAYQRTFSTASLRERAVRSVRSFHSTGSRPRGGFRSVTCRTGGSRAE
jgi:hypothetical protein